MEGPSQKFIADVKRSGKPIKNKPRLNNDGSISNTPLQYEIEVKVGAPVMLTYNIDVIDSLANGVMGVVVGYEKESITSML
jgi:hypothetical protein